MAAPYAAAASTSANAIATAGDDQVIQELAVRRDFAGHWEIDYGQSDQLDETLQRDYYRTRRDVAQQSRNSDDLQLRRGRSTGPRISIGGLTAGGGGVRDLVELGQFTDAISKVGQLHIKQNTSFIQVERQEQYPLACNFSVQAQSAQAAVAEACGWEGDRIRFLVAFPGGYQVHHRLSLSDDGQRLSVFTAVYSPRFSAPFQLNRVYTRYEPLPDLFDCEFTLAAGNVCERAEVSDVSE